MDSDTAMDSSTVRGLLMLRPIPTTPTDSDTPDTMVLVTLDTMVSDPYYAYGLGYAGYHGLGYA